VGERSFAKGMSPYRHTLDEDSASRMLQGAVHPDDAPPGYASVADLLSRAARLPSLDEDAGAATISAMVEAIRAGAPAAAQPARRRSTIGKLFAGKALAAMATVALTATGAAAATGSLPAPVQDAVSEAVSHVGFDLPMKGGKSADHRQDGEHRQSDKGNSADKGQSGADHGRPPGDDGENTGDSSGKGTEISGITHDPALDGLPKGPAVSGVASDGRSQAGEHGKPADGTSTTTTEGSDDDESQGPVGEVGGGDAGDDDHTPPVTTGGKSTGEDRSGRVLAPQGQGKDTGENR
jgi:hypothetical protein